LSLSILKYFKVFLSKVATALWGGFFTPKDTPKLLQRDIRYSPKGEELRNQEGLAPSILPYTRREAGGQAFHAALRAESVT
jgi:hypothetical protein